MKQYPSIDRPPRFGSPVYVYPKYDGSNIRAEWTRKKGFDKFGSRKVLLGADNEQLGAAIGLIRAKTDEFGRGFQTERFEKITCFFEYWGEKSFAGLHEPNDPTLRVTLIDFDIYKKGQADPRYFNDFVQKHEISDAAVCLGQRFTQPDADAVRQGTFRGQTFEGVICKLPPERPWQPPYMFKMKSSAWIAKVKERYGEKAGEFL